MSIIPLVVTAHIQDKGDVTVSGPQEFVGSKGKQRRIEGFSISSPSGIPLEYMAHVEGQGDSAYFGSPYFVGTKGQGRRVEGFAVRLVGPAASQYDVKYYAHIESSGDCPVAANGAFVGSRGQSRRIEGMAVWLEPKAYGAPTPYGYPPAGGYPPVSSHPPPGYPPSAYPPSSGYPPSSAPGYPPSSAPGYPPSSAPGYPPSSAPGYPPSSAPGYPPSSNYGYPPSSAPGYPPSSAPGYPPAGSPYSPTVSYTPVPYPSPVAIPVPVPVPYAVPTPGYPVHNKDHGHGHLNGHTFSIVSCANGKALDGNLEACYDNSKHPRIFLWDHTPSSRNHQWELRHIEGDYYMIISRANGKALDGNTEISQVSYQHPTVFLWEPVRSSHNHHWKFEKVDKDTYVIINRANGKALDSNTSAFSQPKPMYPNVFLWTPVHHSPNHRWKLYRQ